MTGLLDLARAARNYAKAKRVELRKARDGNGMTDQELARLLKTRDDLLAAAIDSATAPSAAAVETAKSARLLLNRWGADNRLVPYHVGRAAGLTLLLERDDPAHAIVDELVRDAGLLPGAYAGPIEIPTTPAELADENRRELAPLSAAGDDRELERARETLSLLITAIYYALPHLTPRPELAGLDRDEYDRREQREERIRDLLALLSVTAEALP